MDTYKMNPDKDPLFRGEFEVVKELVGAIGNGCPPKTFVIKSSTRKNPP